MASTVGSARPRYRHPRVEPGLNPHRCSCNHPAAVGTPRSLLAGIVLAETMLTGLFTAAAAIGVSALTLRVLSGLLEGHTSYLTHLTFPWQAGVAGVIAGLV